jgi:hypothetical protein
MGGEGRENRSTRGGGGRMMEGGRTRGQGEGCQEEAGGVTKGCRKGEGSRAGA